MINFENYKKYYIYKNLIIKKSVNGVVLDTDRKFWIVNVEIGGGRYKSKTFRVLEEALEFFYTEFMKLPNAKKYLLPDQLKIF